MRLFTFRGEIAAADVNVHIQANTLEEAISTADNGCYTWLSVDAGGSLLRGHRFELDDDALVRVDTHELLREFNNGKCPYCEGPVRRESYDGRACAECAVDVAIAAAANERIAARLERNEDQQIAAADALLEQTLKRRPPAAPGTPTQDGRP